MSENFRSDLEMWCDIWDDTVEQGIHPQSQSPQAKDTSLSSNSAQDDYFDYLGSDIESESDLLQEDKIPNPIFPDSAGPDSSKGPAWIKEDLLKEVESLKNKLFDVENKLAKMGCDTKWTEKVVQTDDKKLMSEIESLRKKLEKVSSHLGIEDEPSPWEVKRD
jgi:hypothetical protein